MSTFTPYQPQSPDAHRPVREITPDDLLTWQVQFLSEGTLPPEVQRRLLEHATNYSRPIVGGA